MPRTRERADAVRNRERVLQSARRLFRERDPRTVTMEDLARAAGVGRATLYRRYRDPAAVAVALLDEHERRLQERLIRGEPPLGPGAPPEQRLCAFYAAMVELLEEHLPLALGGEAGAARFRTGAYNFWHLHVRVLLVAAGAPDPETLADALLAPLAPELYQHQRRERGLTPERITRSLDGLARAALARVTPDGGHHTNGRHHSDGTHRPTSPG
ncbi:helix-turn-helix domain-containing protein [Micromonospora sp. NPDC049230]|uniref:TetR/AcrR family transcriptional regulator n=1 Tax=Micromonospora sp. NPDC049230 TaxID=3155502 RepID=UPI0034110C7F